jgi:hypothetical protein
MSEPTDRAMSAGEGEATVRRSTFNDRYETGWQHSDGTGENMATYFAKKLDAMVYAQGCFIQGYRFTYIYDRMTVFLFKFDGCKWVKEGRSR